MKELLKVIQEKVDERTKLNTEIEKLIGELRELEGINK